MSELKFYSLGGANEVGASCYYIGTTKYGVLLDCGIRAQKSGAESLPNITLLNDLPLNLILISHAHLDHIGALPLIHKDRIDVPIISTLPTKRIGTLMLKDAVKVAESSGELIYSLEEALDAVEKIIPVQFNESYTTPEGIKVSFYKSGHILGAAYALIQIENYRILYTGDISLTKQHTVSNAEFPKEKIKVDTIISESTYGDTQLPSRKEEIRAFIKGVMEVLEQGGRILIPSFALGRAQEIILILLSHMVSKIIKECPIYLDGLVRAVCREYHDLFEYLPDELRNFVKNAQSSLFYRETVEVITSNNQRNKILADTSPCIIIASSGMLSGGVSPLYAKKLAGEEKSAIMVVGYQDEESPGRKLLMAKKGDEIPIKNELTELKCDVSQYKLSAHADRVGLVNFLTKFPSYSVILVHGETNPRRELLNTLKNNRIVWCPNNEQLIDPLSVPSWMSEQEITKAKEEIDKSAQTEGQTTAIEQKAVYEASETGDVVKTINRKVNAKININENEINISLPVDTLPFFQGVQDINVLLRRKEKVLLLDGKGQISEEK